MADPATSNLQERIGHRDVAVTRDDRTAARTLFDALPTARRTAAELASLERYVAQNKYDDAIGRAVAQTSLRAPQAPIDPLVVKSLLYQESDFQADPGNRGRYIGIAQIGPGEATRHGLRVDSTVDERLDPQKAIGAVPQILADYDYALPYSHYVREGLGTLPEGMERAKFYLAAYNGGPGTISAAMRIAAADGRDPLVFDNLLARPGEKVESSPLYRAIDTVLRRDAPSIDPDKKYAEIGHYANDIVTRAEAMAASVPGAGRPATPQVRPSAPHPAEAASPPAWHVDGESRHGRPLESRTELAEKNARLGEAIALARAGRVSNFRFEGVAGESAATVAAQNELLDRAIAYHLPDGLRPDFERRSGVSLGPTIVGETREGVPVETPAELDAKNALLQRAIVLAKHGRFDGREFVGNGRESEPELAAQNRLLRESIANALPPDRRAAYVHYLDDRNHVHEPAAARGAYSREAVRAEIGNVPLGSSRDVLEPSLTKRSLVDALGHLEANAGVPIQVNVLNTGHRTTVVDNPSTHGHKAGYAADLVVAPGHDSADARRKLIEGIANDPYVYKVGLGGDYDRADYRQILERAGKTVFEDNDQTHVHIQSEIAATRLREEEAHDPTRRPAATARAMEQRAVLETMNDDGTATLNVAGGRMRLHVPLPPENERAALEIGRLYDVRVQHGASTFAEVERDAPSVSRA